VTEDSSRTLSKTNKRVPNAKLSFKSWVTMKMVILFMFQSLRMSVCMSAVMPGSNAPKGSSSNKIFGSPDYRLSD